VQAVHGVRTPILTPDYSGIGRAILQGWSDARMAVCLVGAEAAILGKARKVIERNFPGLIIDAAFDGFGASVETARNPLPCRQPRLSASSMRASPSTA